MKIQCPCLVRKKSTPRPPKRIMVQIEVPIWRQTEGENRKLSTSAEEDDGCVDRSPYPEGSKRGVLSSRVDLCWGGVQLSSIFISLLCSNFSRCQYSILIFPQFPKGRRTPRARPCSPSAPRRPLAGPRHWAHARSGKWRDGVLTFIVMNYFIVRISFKIRDFLPKFVFYTSYFVHACVSICCILLNKVSLLQSCPACWTPARWRSLYCTTYFASKQISCFFGILKSASCVYPLLKVICIYSLVVPQILWLLPGRWKSGVFFPLLRRLLQCSSHSSNIFWTRNTINTSQLIYKFK